MAFKTPMLFTCLFLFNLITPIVSHSKFEAGNDEKISAFEFLRHLPAGCHKGDKIKGLHQLKKYLHRFGYLNDLKSIPLDDFDDSLESALRIYQLNYHCKVTGRLDADTISKMSMPRCGMPDIVNGTNRMQQRSHHGHGSTKIHTVSHYSFFPGNPRWPESKSHLTYAFQDNTPSAATSPVMSAFNRWASVSHFTFSQVQSTAGADLVIGFHSGDHGDGRPFDGPGGVLAHAAAPTRGWFHYDADERWSVGAAAGAFDLETLALHEIGHLLGLGHSSVPNAIMYPSIAPGVTKGLHADDVRGIRALYN